MLVNCLVFAAIGLLAGAAARVLYPGRQLTHVVGTMLVGVGGAVAGGVISWMWWPAVDGDFQTGNLIVSALGAVTVIVFGAGIAYQRRLRGARSTSR